MLFITNRDYPDAGLTLIHVIEYPMLSDPQLPVRERVGSEWFPVSRLAKRLKRQLGFDTIQYDIPVKLAKSLQLAEGLSCELNGKSGRQNVGS